MDSYKNFNFMQIINIIMKRDDTLWKVRFNDENTRIFEQKLEQFTGKTYPMGIEQFLLQRAENQGVKKGIEKGIEKGVDINKQEVIRNARVIEKLSIETIANIVALSPQRVRQILDTLGIE